MTLGRNAVLIKAIGTALGTAHGELDRRITKFEQRIAELERTRVKYMGLFERGVSYPVGQLRYV